MKTNNLEDLKKELKDIIISGNKEAKLEALRKIANAFASQKQWDQAKQAIESISSEKERNLLIADLIEEHLIPAKELEQAKKFAKLLTPVPEIQPLVLVRLALVENNGEQALHIAQNLSSPLSRHYALLHIVEYFLQNKEKDKAYEASQLMFENARTIYDPKIRSFILREIAIELFLANGEKDKAREVANLIPNETVKTQVLNKVGK